MEDEEGPSAPRRSGGGRSERVFAFLADERRVLEQMDQPEYTWRPLSLRSSSHLQTSALTSDPRTVFRSSPTKAPDQRQSARWLSAQLFVF
ncbi:hypothetical protein EYF80_034982 [Liparis tanakae]|uniref:Uncharacterized protein n=1 Tax=Liparis tanakae TaxID=230148 RepID=A0A4Z2GMN4_9TELE|nr:hypothetical protein EYF80_034982 [Liparis tanakae]